MKRLTLLFIFILSFFSLSFAQTNVSGTIAANTTWNAAGSPYIVTGNVTVNSGYILTVEATVEVRFQGNTSLIIYGELDADEVVFTSDAASPDAGDWNYIQIGSSSYTGTADFKDCTIQYGGGYSSYPANIYAYSGTVNIDGCDIAHSLNYGLVLYRSADVTITNSNIFSNNWPIVYRGAAALQFSGTNNFTGNTHDGVYLYFTSASSNFILNYVDIPYVILTNLTINSGATMEIAAGNIFKLSTSDNLIIRGTLIANGLVSNKIYFTSYKDDNLGGDTNADATASAPGSRDWAAVKFEDSSNDATCVMQYCVVSFGGSGSVGSITVEDASPHIQYCEMNNNYYGAMIKGVSAPVFSNNTIGSSEMVPIAMSFDANPVFTDNVFSFSDNEYDAIGLLGGTLGVNSVLPIRNVTAYPNVTYLMLGTLTVPEGFTLTINEGVVLKGYTSSHRIKVLGKLVADASDANRITITSAKDDNYGNPSDTNRDGSQSDPNTGDWGGIIFESSSDPTSILDYCRIKYAEMPSSYYNTRYIYDGAITMENASPTISNCEITDVVYGIYAFQSSNPTISNNQIINSTKTPIALSVSADPVFSGNTFTNTKWTALGIIGENVGANGVVKKRNVAGFTNITYLLLEDLTVNSGTNVSVQPEVVIKFASSAGINVDGGFKAEAANLAEQIVFTSYKDDNFGNPNDTNGDGSATSPSQNDWEYIHYQATADDSYNLLKYCLIQFGGSGSKGIVTFTDAGGNIAHSILGDSYYYGLYCDGASNPTIDHTTIQNSRLDPIAMSLKANPTFTNITFSGNGSNGIRIIEGTLSSDASLAQRDVAGINNIAYIVDRLTISENAVLTINPGVVIKFYNTYSRINVNGALVANGTEAQKIVFTSLKDDSEGGDTNTDGTSTAPVWGDWWSIIFNSSDKDGQNSLQHCLIQYGGRDQSGWSNRKDYGAVRVFDAVANIENCTIQLSHTSGIGVYGSATPTISNNDIVNIRLTPITMSLFADPSFTNNEAYNIGIFALGIAQENYSLSATIPKRNFAGYTNITYFMYVNSTINSGTTLTIPAGVVFKYDYYDCFDVEGAILVNGTEAEPVVFTHEHDDSYGNPADTNTDGATTSPSISSSYYALDFYDVSDDASSVTHAIFRYRQAGINLRQAAPTITHSLFEYNNWGIILDGVSTPVIENNAFDDLTYAPMRISLVSYPASLTGNSISGTTYRAIGVLSETLTQDVTLEKKTFAGITNIPYYFHGNYTIGTSVTLTLNPGVVLKFAEYRYLTVEKGLIAEGGAAADETIVFTHIRDDFYGGDTNADGDASSPSYTHGWDGLRFSDVALDPYCRLDHTIFKYAGRSSTAGAINTTSASPSITNSVFTKNRHALIAKEASNPVINYCDIYNNYDFGVDNQGASFVIDATNNWWGSNSGPTHSGNPGGTGQKVSDMVNYSPWLNSGANNPLMGDVSLNGLVQAFDASQILKYSVGSITFNTRQEAVADVSASGGITAYDASLILQYVVGLISHFPAEVNSKMDMSAPDAIKTENYLALQKVEDVGLTIGSALGHTAEEITIPIYLNQNSGVVALQVDLEFDPDLLRFTKIDLEEPFKDLNLAHEFNSENGTLRIAAAGTTPMAEDGIFAYLSFQIADDIAGDVQTTLKVNKFLANETDFTTMAVAGNIEIAGTPLEFKLEQNYPNPFNGITKISYQLAENTNIKIIVYNVLGEAVKTLKNGYQETGIYQVFWNGENDLGHSVASGLYILRMQAGNFVQTKKLHFLK